MSYASSCSGSTITIGVSSSGARGSSRTKSRAAIEDRRELLVAARRERDDRSAARLDLLHVADHLLEHVIARRDRDDRHLLVDERDRAVLHLAGRIALGVDVRDFLQLQRAFERDRVVDAAAEVEEIGAVVEARRDLLDLGRELQRLLEQLRQLQQRVDVRLRRLGRQRAARLAEPQAEQIQRDELRRERLGRGDADFRPGVRVDRARRSRASPCCRRRCRWRCCWRRRCFASRSAASVSAVSPDCVMTTASVFGATIGPR